MKINFKILILVALTIILLKLFYINNSLSQSDNFKPVIQKINKTLNLNKLNEFKSIHRNIVEGKSQIKFSINGMTDGGYGNKLYSMLTSFVIAILTDSALIIRWNDIDKFINEPFYSTFKKYDEQNDFNREYHPRNTYMFSISVSEWLPVKDMNLLTQTKIPKNKSFYFYNIPSAYFFEICSNPIYYEKLYYYDLIAKETKDKALEITENMANYSNEFKADNILKIGYEVGGNLLNRMWIPKDDILNNVNYYLENIFKDYFMIGIQLRYEYLSDEQDTQAFFKCALSIEKDKHSEILNKYKGVKWFVTCDTKSILTRLIYEYPDKIVIGKGEMGHVEQDLHAYPRVILDVELLSHCNELIISGGSSYGFVAAIKSKKLPFYVNGRQNMKKCVKRGLSELSITNRGRAVF